MWKAYQDCQCQNAPNRSDQREESVPNIAGKTLRDFPHDLDVGGGLVQLPDVHDCNGRHRHLHSTLTPA